MTLTVASETFRDHGSRIVHEFSELLRLDNLTRHNDLLAVNADAIITIFATVGVELRSVVRGEAAPLVIGRLEVDPTLPTMGIYVHYDGQPVGEPDWLTAPFDPVIKSSTASEPASIPSSGPINPDLRIFARGSADDRAPLIALVEALRTLRREGRRPTVNLVFCFEGEEEHGSPNLSAYLDELKDELAADAWWFCDGPVHQSGNAQVVCGVRGYAGIELTVFGPLGELHSGHYGNWIPNPAQTLVEILASCKMHGQVEIEGFDSCATPITTSDRAAIAALPDSDESVLRQLGIATPERDVPLFESVLSSSFNIRGLQAGTVAPHTRNVIPAEASASIDMRLAQGVDPDAAIADVVRHLSGLGVHFVDDEPTAEDRRQHSLLVRLRGQSAYPGIRVAPDSPLVTHTAELISATTGRNPVVLPSLGGSLPFHYLRHGLGVDGVIVPIANHDNNQHAANENMRLGNLAYGIELFLTLLTTESPLGTSTG